MPRGRIEARRRGPRVSRARPAVARAVGSRCARRRRPLDRSRRRRARGAAHARDGRRGRRADPGGRVRSPRGAGRARDRARRAVPAGVARAGVPAERRTHRRRRPTYRRVLMAERVFDLPDLGEGLEEGTISAWLVAEGDEVGLNQPIAEIETAKAVVEMPSPYAGRIVALHVAAGADARVGEALVTFEVVG